MISVGDRETFIPYRNNRLTQMLQDAIGGNSKTVFIAHIPPTDVLVAEAVIALNVSKAALKVRNKLVKFVDGKAIPVETGETDPEPEAVQEETHAAAGDPTKKAWT
jgi:hypothetical protein